jgi:hypothetical protein
MIAKKEADMILGRDSRFIKKAEETPSLFCPF